MAVATASPSDGLGGGFRANGPDTPRRAPVEAPPQLHENGLPGAILEVIAGRDASLGALNDTERAELTALYQACGFGPLWSSPAGRLQEDAREALALLRRAADEGLVPADYHAALLDRLTPVLQALSPASRRDLALFDVALSSATLRYFRHVHNGRIDPRAIGFRLTVPVDRHDFVAVLRSALADHRIAATAEALRPPLEQYGALRTMLSRYRSLAADGAFETYRAGAPDLRPGDTSARVDTLHGQLLRLGDLPPDTPVPPEARYDGALVDGVRRFQTRHGLRPDGVVGKATQAALRVPVAWRVRQIELALERLRWLPHLGDKRLVLINIPMFTLRAWDSIGPGQRPSLGMDVIVGRAIGTQTPVFVEEMREVIMRPYWNVPRSILRHEILPILERDPGYLQRQHMEIVGANGDAAQPAKVTAENIAGLREGTLRVRQRPGSGNALGPIKFVFPNQENVYMHGTPVEQLFDRSRRDFSHGCVRLRDPVALAEWALQDRPEWTHDRILDAIAGSHSVRVELTRPIQVVLFYTTAAVTPQDGMIRFAEDIYRHDERLDRALPR